MARLCSPLDGFPLLCASGRTSAMHADIVSSRRAMLRYYTVTFAFLLSTNLENNCFLSGRSLFPPPPPSEVHRQCRLGCHERPSCIMPI